MPSEPDYDYADEVDAVVAEKFIDALSARSLVAILKEIADGDHDLSWGSIDCRAQGDAGRLDALSGSL